MPSDRPPRHLESGTAVESQLAMDATPRIDEEPVEREAGEVAEKTGGLRVAYAHASQVDAGPLQGRQGRP